MSLPASEFPVRPSPGTSRVSQDGRRPVGIYAAVLVIAILVGAGSIGQIYAIRLAARYAPALAAMQLPIKSESLTFQRGALSNGFLLPIYGSSELYCCGDPMRGTQIFADAPTGFDLFAVGRAGTADLFFLETFGALGDDLRGKELIISDSPPWFFGPGGINAKAYAGNFSPEIADAFVFDAPLSLDLKEAAARRMLDYPATLRSDPVLNFAVHALATGTPIGLAEYIAVDPIGRADSWIHQLQDASDTVSYIRSHPGLDPLTPDENAIPRQLNWNGLVALGTQIAQDRVADTPWGFPAGPLNKLRPQRQYRQALALYCSGQTNHDGNVLPEPVGWERNMVESKEWTDLTLELRALNQLGAKPFVWSLPMPGAWDDYTQISQPARMEYYHRFDSVVIEAGVPWYDFQAHDDDRFFLTDTGAHFSPRGWVFADRAVDLFWHGQSITTIRAALAQLAAQSHDLSMPSPSAESCVGQ